MQWLLIYGISASGIHAITSVLHQEVMHCAFQEGVSNLVEEEECGFPSLMALYSLFSFLFSFSFHLLIRLFGRIYMFVKVGSQFFFFVLIFFLINGSIAILKDEGLVQCFPVAMCLL